MRAMRCARPIPPSIHAHPIRGRRWLAWSVLAMAWACTEPAPAPTGVDAQVASTAAAPTTRPGARPAGPEVPFLDLVEAADRAHVRRDGPYMAPGVPGWQRVTQLADRTPWGAVTEVDKRPASWLESIGGSLHFPVGAHGKSLRALKIWLKPIARGQRVSIFLDEEPVTTMRLKEKGSWYTLPLGEDGLEPGEHSVRFWFRFRRKRTRRSDTKTPAALGAVRLVGAADLPESPTWTTRFAVAGVEGPALLAGPPTGWTHYLLPPVGARLRARAAVASGEPVTFVVNVERDGQPPVSALRVEVSSGTVAELDVDLHPYANTPIRLSLDTEGAAGDHARAAWIAPVITMPGTTRATVPTVRNVIVLAVDGLRADRVGLGRGGDRAATPNLDMLATQGGGAVDVWSGGASAEDGHRRLLAPIAEVPSLPRLMAESGRITGYLGASRAVPPQMSREFTTRIDLHRAGEAAQARAVLRELDDWLDVRKKDPFFLYLAVDEPRTPLEPPEGYLNVYRRARPLVGEPERSPRRRARDLMAAYDAEVSAIDYWIGRMLAVMNAHAVTEQTALIVVGTVGQDLGEAGGLGDGHTLAPELLQVPLVIWHPGVRSDGARPLVRGGDLADVGPTALTLAGVAVPASWPGEELAASVLRGAPLPPRPSHARLGNQVAARFGDWLLRGLGTRDLKLWDLLSDPAARNELSEARPISLRALRDSMLDRE